MLLSQDYEEALQRFETARELCDLVARSASNMEARKNGAVSGQSC